MYDEEYIKRVMELTGVSEESVIEALDTLAIEKAYAQIMQEELLKPNK